MLRHKLNLRTRRQRDIFAHRAFYSRGDKPPVPTLQETGPGHTEEETESFAPAWNQTTIPSVSSLRPCHLTFRNLASYIYGGRKITL